ncbi:MAG: hypothetical protein M1835_003649 [Candelina submexicana]|nr:MAG: hypothetical protein M1835_003649 [Candelina submexicana]
MINDDLPLTFGVELELVFIFHEDRLKKILSQKPSTASATIVKQLSNEDRDTLGEGRNYLAYNDMLPRHYNSWGLANAGTHPYAKTTEDGSIRRYGIEPLEIVREVLLPVRPNVRIHEERAKPDDHSIFNDWHITNDYSLIGVDKSQMIKELPQRIPDSTAAEKWDSLGVEVVSRVLDNAENAETEIAAILSALKGDSSSLHGVTLTEHCAVHVHVGQGASGFSLPTLQHLAYLLVVYEREIAKILPVTRREGSSSSAAERRSNQDKFFAEARYEIQWKLRNGEMVQREVQLPYVSLAEVRHRIFEAEGSTLEGLIDLISPVRASVVNFKYLAEEGRPPTIEFRQHHGCLSAEEIKYWVMFVTGLVRLADHYAQTGWSCPVTEWNNHTSFWDLLEGMHFPPDGIRHLKAKAAYNVEWPPSFEEFPDWTPPKSDDSNGGSDGSDNRLGSDQLEGGPPEDDNQGNVNRSGTGSGDVPSGQKATGEQDQTSAPESGIRKSGYHPGSSDEGVREFEAIIAKGYGRRAISAAGYLCGVRALATSLTAVRREMGHRESPTDSELLEIIDSEEYKASKKASIHQIFGHERFEGPEAEEEREKLIKELEGEWDATSDLTTEQLCIILRIVGRRLGQNYRLGVCTERDGKHQVYIYFTSKGSATAPVVWLHNDGNEFTEALIDESELEALEGEASQTAHKEEIIPYKGHWSAIAPGGTPIIVRAEAEATDDPEPETGGSHKRKRGDEDKGEAPPAHKSKR